MKRVRITITENDISEAFYRHRNRSFPIWCWANQCPIATATAAKLQRRASVGPVYLIIKEGASVPMAEIRLPKSAQRFVAEMDLWVHGKGPRPKPFFFYITLPEGEKA